MGVAHWDDVAGHRLAEGEKDATWQALGDAAGTHGVGVNRVRVEPGKLPTPPHAHGVSEELYFVLAGSGVAWQGGQAHEVRPRDCVIQRPGGREHTFLAGSGGLEYLVFGTRHPTEPAAWGAEAAVQPLAAGDPIPRPPNIVNVDEVEHERWENRMTSAPLATRERSDLAGLHWERIEPRRRGTIPHCHSSEEEVFVILDGTATLELWPSPRDEGGAREEIAVRAGHVVARPAGTRVSHSFRAGPDGVTMLTYGTRDVNDICWYPRSNKVYWRGVGVIGRIERLDYLDGEPLDDD